MYEIKCPSCGTICDAGTAFCGQCGTKIEAQQNAMRYAQDKTSNKSILYAIIGVLTVVVLTIVIFFSMFVAKEKKYQEAYQLYNNAISSMNYYSELSTAQSLFSSLNGYKDSEFLIQDCENEIKYLDAIQLLDDVHGAPEADKVNIYIRAKDVFYALGRYKNSSSLARECENNIQLLQSNAEYKRESEEKENNYYMIQDQEGRDPNHGIGPFVPADETSIVDRNGDGYYKVMVGSANSKNAANNLRTELINRGFDKGSFVVYENGAYRVQIGAFDKVKSAQNEINKLNNAGYRDFIVR